MKYLDVTLKAFYRGFTQFCRLQPRSSGRACLDLFSLNGLSLSPAKPKDNPIGTHVHGEPSGPLTLGLGLCLCEIWLFFGMGWSVVSAFWPS